MASQELKHFRFPCTLCEAHFEAPHESAAHRVSAHGKPEDEAYLCHACPRTFFSQEAVEFHAGTHLMQPPERAFPCFKCKGMFRTLFTRRLHVEYDHDECKYDAEGRRWCAVAGCNFTQEADYGMSLHAIHEHGAVPSKKRSREESSANEATPAKRARRTPTGSNVALAPAPGPANIPTAGWSTEPAWELLDSAWDDLLQKTQLDQLFADFMDREGIQLTSASLPKTAPAAPTAPQAEVIDLTADEVIDLTADEPSPPPSAPTVPSAPRPAPLSLEEQLRNRAAADAFLASQTAALEEREAATGGRGAEGVADILKNRKHAVHMQKWRANREAMRVHVPSAEAAQRLEREKAEEMKRNAALEGKEARREKKKAAMEAQKEGKKAEKEAKKDAKKAEKAAMQEAKKAMKAAMKSMEGKTTKTAAPTAGEEEASPRQKVKASPAVEARSSIASAEQDAAAADKSWEMSEDDHLATLISSPASGPQTPITSPEDGGLLVLDDEDEDSEYMRSKRLEAQAAEQQGGEGEEEEEEDLEAQLARALAEDDEQAVNGDDQGSLFGERLEDLFGEGEDDAPARPVTPAPGAPHPARNSLCLPTQKCKD